VTTGAFLTASSGSLAPARRGGICHRNSATGTRSGAIPPLVPVRRLGRAGAGLRRSRRRGRRVADDRQYRHPGPSLCGRHKRGAHNQALGRSRGGGGVSCKIHLRVNAMGLPIALLLTAGEAHDVTAYDGLMQSRDSDPGVLVAARATAATRSARTYKTAVPGPRSRRSETGQCSIRLTNRPTRDDRVSSTALAI
jgi:hypothetical protein